MNETKSVVTTTNLLGTRITRKEWKGAITCTILNKISADSLAKLCIYNS